MLIPNPQLNFDLSKFELWIVGRTLGGRRVARREEGALAYVGTDATSPQEFKDIFGLDKGSLVLIYGDPGTPGSYTAAGFGLLVPDYPTQEELEELKEQHGYELLPD